MGENEVRLLCGHCHQRVTALERARYHEVYTDYTSFGEIELWREWRLLECGACARPILQELDSEGDWAIPGYEPPVLYPVAGLELEGLPSSVAKAYGEAVRVQTISPPACVTMIGRTLEAVCKDQVATGRNLEEKLTTLANNERLPLVLAQMARQLRQLRNLGAHADDEDEVTGADIPILMDFLDAILEYLYVAPRKLQKVEARLNRRSLP
jgi:hypothetical protein